MTDNQCICEWLDLEKNDTLFYCSGYDNGVMYERINNIKYCPVCGKELKEDNYE